MEEKYCSTGPRNPLLRRGAGRVARHAGPRALHRRRSVSARRDDVHCAAHVYVCMREWTTGGDGYKAQRDAVVGNFWREFSGGRRGRVLSCALLRKSGEHNVFGTNSEESWIVYCT